MWPFRDANKRLDKFLEDYAKDMAEAATADDVKALQGRMSALEKMPWLEAVNNRIGELNERCNNLVLDISGINQQLGMKPVKAIHDLCERTCKIEAAVADLRKFQQEINTVVVNHREAHKQERDFLQLQVTALSRRLRKSKDARKLPRKRTRGAGRKRSVSRKAS